jgi:endo-1,4-beta-xylanase
VINKSYSARDRETQWGFERQSDGTYIITNVNSGRVIDVPGGSQTSGEKLVQWDRNGGGNQRWKIVQAGDGYVTFVCQYSGKVLDIPSNTSANGTQVIQWDSNNGDGQKFKLVPVK